jgi:hypothetical protein
MKKILESIEESLKEIDLDSITSMKDARKMFKDIIVAE